MDDHRIAALEERLEEKLAHLERAVADLSEVVVRQEGEIARLARLVDILRDREADRTATEGGVTLGDARPPHW